MTLVNHYDVTLVNHYDVTEEILYDECQTLEDVLVHSLLYIVYGT